VILLDVNVLVLSNRIDMPRHEPARNWLEQRLADTEVVGLPDSSLAGYLRLVINHRIFPNPTSPQDAIAFCAALLGAPAARRVSPGTGHWQVFVDFINDLGLRANDIPDAHLAALAVEHGAALATSDRGFARFSGLRLVDPGDG